MVRPHLTQTAHARMVQFAVRAHVPQNAVDGGVLEKPPGLVGLNLERGVERKL